MMRPKVLDGILLSGNNFRVDNSLAASNLGFLGGKSLDSYFPYTYVFGLGGCSSASGLGFSLHMNEMI